MSTKKERLLGKLPLQYIFILNPYAEYRFTRCPGCEPNRSPKLKKRQRRKRTRKRKERFDD